MDVAEVLLAHFELKLPESFDEGHPLNVSDGATQLRGGAEKCETDCVLVKLTNTCYVYIYTYACTYRQLLAQVACAADVINCVCLQDLSHKCVQKLYIRNHMLFQVLAHTPQYRINELCL